MADDKTRHEDQPSGGVRHDPTAVPGEDYNPQPGDADPTGTVPDEDFVNDEDDGVETPG
ncbi:MAG: hypothetical protein KIT08_08510 [Anaerolineales bacterium]|nr:MAG: hypothetical protein KIT08_08510 [Anaerolineales bacterium]